MRLIHLAELADTGHVEPRCGAWGSMDTDWTGIASGVTCLGCKTALAPPDAKDAVRKRRAAP